MYPSKLLQELRLMKDQPDHRFYSVCVVAVVVVVVPACAYVLKS